MKVIYNNIIPFGSFCAMNLFGLVLFVKGHTISKTTMNHEKIHSEQWKETLYIGFVVIYLFEFVRNLAFELRHSNNKLFKNKWYSAYRLISFECEAYSNESKGENYLLSRKRNAWKEYL